VFVPGPKERGKPKSPSGKPPQTNPPSLFIIPGFFIINNPAHNIDTALITPPNGNILKQTGFWAGKITSELVTE